LNAIGSQPDVRTVTVLRYVAPLREGGSLPAIVEADDLGTYVLKFRGAGQGAKVLIAELIAGEIGRLLGLPVPDIVFAELDERLGRAEPDPEIQELIQNSAGLNLAIDYLPGSLTFDAADARNVEPALASDIVWFDAYFTNVDRTARNTNMLIWHRELWLIDHGAALYVHFGDDDYAARAQSRFPQIRDHVLLPVASDLEAADERMTARLTRDMIQDVVSAVPDEWLAEFGVPGERRAAYVEYLVQRLDGERAFVREAIDARARLV
jgi:hypothetical protein